MTVTIEKTRTTQEVCDSHMAAILDLDVPKLMSDYAEDAVLISADGVLRGKDSLLKDFFGPNLSLFPDIKFTYDKVVVEGEICLMQFSAEASGATVPFGIGVLFIEDGLIQKQVEWFHLVPKEV